jgi:lipoprotein Spr
MPRSAEEIVARARSLVGARFRPQGRSAETGFDCVGVVAEAVGVVDVPTDYAARGGTAADLGAKLETAGFERAAAMRAGDVLVMVPGPVQFHLGIFTGSGVVHGYAGLRRVVERPAPLPWPILGAWRVRAEWRA